MTSLSFWVLYFFTKSIIFLLDKDLQSGVLLLLIIEDVDVPLGVIYMVVSDNSDNLDKDAISA